MLGKGGVRGSTPTRGDFGPPRELAAFERFLREGSPRAPRYARPAGTPTPVRDAALAAQPALKWNVMDTGYRWNNGATASWFRDGAAKMTGGGATAAANALAAWTNEPNSLIAYTTTSDPAANPIHMDALSSPCGWSTCIGGSGVVGCGGPQSSGSHAWRGDTYGTIVAGEVWLRSYCTTNLFSSTETQSILEHELGHTLGLDHSDQGISPHDSCIGDEADAIMASVSMAPPACACTSRRDRPPRARCTWRSARRRSPRSAPSMRGQPCTAIA